MYSLCVNLQCWTFPTLCKHYIIAPNVNCYKHTEICTFVTHFVTNLSGEHILFLKTYHCQSLQVIHFLFHFHSVFRSSSPFSNTPSNRGITQCVVMMCSHGKVGHLTWGGPVGWVARWYFRLFLGPLFTNMGPAHRCRILGFKRSSTLCCTVTVRVFSDGWSGVGWNITSILYSSSFSFY